MSVIRSLVSKKKRRFQENGFDLDLSYITDRMIAMGFPSEKLEGIYRNPLEEVYRFLETTHKGHYKIYNLCSERQYDPTKFHNRVVRFPFDDHNPSPFEMIHEFCEDVFLTQKETYLGEHHENVAVVHCKAGKGRTGMMICAWLLHTKQWETAKDALAFFADSRTENNKGVTIPSQRRYVQYYEQSLREGQKQPQTYEVKMIRFHTFPNFDLKGCCEPWFRVSCKSERIYSSKHSVYPVIDTASETIELRIDGLIIQGDVKFEFFHQDIFTSDEMFHFWICTRFMDGKPLFFAKESLDKAIKDRGHRLFKPNFQLEIVYSIPEPGVKKIAEPITSPRTSSKSLIKNLQKDIFMKSDRTNRTSKPETLEAFKALNIDDISTINEAVKTCKQVLLVEKQTPANLTSSELSNVENLISSMDETLSKIRARLRVADRTCLTELKRELEPWPVSLTLSAGPISTTGTSSSSDEYAIITDIDGKLRDITNRVRALKTLDAARIGTTLCFLIAKSLPSERPISPRVKSSSPARLHAHYNPTAIPTLGSNSANGSANKLQVLSAEEREQVDNLRSAVRELYTSLTSSMETSEIKGLYILEQTVVMKEWVGLMAKLAQEVQKNKEFCVPDLLQTDLHSLVDFTSWDHESRVYSPSTHRPYAGSFSAHEIFLAHQPPQRPHTRDDHDEAEEDDDDDDEDYTDTSARKKYLMEIHKQTKQVSEWIQDSLRRSRDALEHPDADLNQALNTARFVRRLQNVVDLNKRRR